MTAPTATLADFILARIAEDRFHALGHCEDYHPCPQRSTHPGHLLPESRVLAQCAALRKVVEKAQRADAAFARQLTPATSAAVMAMTEVVTMLAAIWADHEDYEAAVS